MNVGYDLDGVLAEPPPPPARPWRRLKAAERAAYQLVRETHFGNAKLLYRPPEERYAVLTARRKSSATSAWVSANLGAAAVVHYLPPGVSKTFRDVAAWKATVIRQLAITRYYEDSQAIVRLLRKELGAECDVVLVAVQSIGASKSGQ